eukprot:6188052-Pleurochrysis_carterae.AAC.9
MLQQYNAQCSPRIAGFSRYTCHCDNIECRLLPLVPSTYWELIRLVSSSLNNKTFLRHVLYCSLAQAAVSIPSVGICACYK